VTTVRRRLTERRLSLGYRQFELFSRIGAKAILHIAIDAHSVGAELGGNESYATNLIEALAQIDQTNLYTLYVTRRAAIDRFADRWPNFKVRRTPPHTPLLRIPLTLSRELRRHPVDVLHVQYTAPLFAPCPLVQPFTIWLLSICAETSNGAVGCNFA